MSSYTALTERVVVAGGLMQVRVEELRDLEGAGKLGSIVRESIETHVSRAGLRMLERRVPNDQRATLWLVSPTTTYGGIIWEAVVEMRAANRRAA